VIPALVRTVVVPVALLAAVASTFSPAFPAGGLWRAGAVAVVLALGIGGALAWRRVPVWAAPPAVLAGVVLAGAIAPPTPVWPGDLAGAVATFLSVGLPATGLPTLLVVPALVVLVAGLPTVAASRHRRPLLTLAGPVAGATLGALLVAPATPPTAAFVALAVLAAVVLASDARSGIDAIPPLVGSRTEERRHRSWWRTALQLGVTVGAVAAAVALPLPAPADLRGAVGADTIRVEDPNPLSVAARWSGLEEPEPAATVDVDGAVPGRFRLSVLETYRPTGWEQAAEFGETGTGLAPDPLDVLDRGRRTEPLRPVRVRVDPAPGLRPFRGVPTAGQPVSVDDPASIRFAPGPGVLLDTAAARPVAYRTVPTPAPPVDPGLPPTVVPDVPVRLLDCPDIEAARVVADQLTAGLLDHAARLDAIEDWLLTRRIYDPGAPGGQTSAAVASFLGTPFARGNLEVFVTAYALLARCAGVPVRVVVGFPEVPAGRTTLDQGDVAAWVEVPVAGEGWTARDPLPTPEEQERLAQLASERPEEPEPEPPEPSGTATMVPPTDPPTAGRDLGPALLALAAAAALAVLLLLLPVLTRARRRRAAEPTAAVLAAWATVLDALVDRGAPVAGTHTPQEVVDAVATHVPVPVRRAIALLAPLADAARYRGTPATEEEAGRAWALADLVVVRLADGAAARTAPLRHPLVALRRLAGTRGTPTRRRRWRADLPEEVSAVAEEAPADIPGVTLDSRIGAGSTGTVFRGTVDATGEDVAVKVFRFGPGDEGFDERRFEWEVRIAQEVSGYPHLPVVHAAGTTPSQGRPYLVTTRYERGTLLDRVRRGGPLTTAEVLAVGADVAAALWTLHQLGVVHGDVKPENVFAAPDGWVLGDLGSAWLRAGRGPARSLTPPYAAPEVWRRSSPTVAADLYSLALTLRFAATGEVPVAGNPPDVDELRELFPDHPELVRALDPDPRRRPRSAADLARRLRATPLSPAFPDGGLRLPTPSVTPNRT